METEATETEAATSAQRPGQLLDGITVVEASDTPAAAFAAALAADFGASVIVCEPLGHGSALRRLGPSAVRRVWWPIIARNKRSLAIDASRAEAQPVLTRLAARADLLLRDPCATGTQLHSLLRDQPHVVDVHLFPTGSDRPELWPWSTEPEFAAAASGLMALTGLVDGPAVQAEMPLADYCAGMMALSVALAELRAARRTGNAATSVPMALHEALHRMNEWNVVVASQRGKAELRNGSRFPMNANIGNIFRTRDGQLLTVSAATPSVADRLLTMIGGAELRNDPRFRTPADRVSNMDALDVVVAEWIGRHDAAEAMQRVREHDVVVGPIADAQALLTDAHLAARGDIVRIDGTAMPNALPLLQPCPGRVTTTGPAVGADSDAILTELGFDADQIHQLRRQGVVGDSSMAGASGA